MGERIGYLDGWRALAVGGVLFAHFVPITGLNAGRLGVEMFFVLSGRLMADILFVRHGPLVPFYARRASRIFPALLVAVCAIYAVSRVAPIGWVSRPQLLAGLSLTYNYAQLWIGRSTPIDHLWSLCVEEHLYVLLGVIAVLSRRYRVPVMPVLAVLILAAWCLGTALTLAGQPYDRVYWRSDVRGASILVGAAMYLWLRARTGRMRLAPFAPLACAALGVVLSLDAVPDPLKYSLGTSALAASLCLIGHAPEPMLRVLGGRGFRLIGLASFSIYLWQQPFYAAHPIGWARPAAFAVALVVGLLSYRLIERPARARLNRLWSKPGDGPRLAKV